MPPFCPDCGKDLALDPGSDGYRCSEHRGGGASLAVVPKRVTEMAIASRTRELCFLRIIGLPTPIQAKGNGKCNCFVVVDHLVDTNDAGTFSEIDEYTRMFEQEISFGVKALHLLDDKGKKYWPNKVVIKSPEVLGRTIAEADDILVASGWRSVYTSNQLSMPLNPGRLVSELSKGKEFWVEDWLSFEIEYRHFPDIPRKSLWQGPWDPNRRPVEKTKRFGIF